MTVRQTEAFVASDGKLFLSARDASIYEQEVVQFGARFEALGRYIDRHWEEFKTTSCAPHTITAFVANYWDSLRVEMTLADSEEHLE